MTIMTLQAVRQLIANDSYAITFQSVEQYRTTLLRHFDNLTTGLAAAQQAAAPGTLDADEMTRLRRLIHVLGMDGSTNASDDQVRGLLFTALGQAAGKLERAPSAPGTPEPPADDCHPLQPLVEDSRGTVRFKANAIIVHQTRDKLNELACMDFSTEDREQLAQLIGYSLGGFAELSYVTDETYDRAAAQPVVQRAAQLDGGQGEKA